MSRCHLQNVVRSAARNCRLLNIAPDASVRMPAGLPIGQHTVSKSIDGLPSAWFVRSATRPFRIIPSIAAGTAAMPAISRNGITEGSAMTTEQLRREMLFQASMACVGQMRRSGLLTDAEYEKCREMMLEKYNPPLGKIVSN